MLSAMLACDNILGANHAVWSINEEGDYHEEVTRDESQRDKDMIAVNESQPRVPIAESALLDAVLHRILGRIVKARLAAAVGTVCGSLFFMVTLIAILRADPFLSSTVGLLGEYFFGYTLTINGAFLGLMYGFVWGSIVGWMFAYIYNLSLGLYSRFVLGKTRRAFVRDLLEYL